MGHDLDAVFRALAEPNRRRLLDQLHERDGQTLRDLCEGMAGGSDPPVTRQAVSQHLAVLEACGLVVSLRRGREKVHHLNPAPLHEITERWLRKYDGNRLAALAEVRRALEEKSDD
jgi:DNA-binding transcriptional ArsR family regulator